MCEVVKKDLVKKYAVYQTKDHGSYKWLVAKKKHLTILASLADHRQNRLLSIHEFALHNHYDFL